MAPTLHQRLNYYYLIIRLRLRTGREIATVWVGPTYQRAPPHLPKWPRRLTRAFSGQLHLTRVMFPAASFQGSSPLGTTCAHAPMYMSFQRRTIVTSCPAFYTLTFIECI